METNFQADGKPTFSEKLLLRLSRAPGGSDYEQGGDDRRSPESALNLLRRVFPRLEEDIRGKKLLDFGCGEGWQCIGLVKTGAVSAVGIESNPKTIRAARHLVDSLGMATKIEFFEAMTPALEGSFDVVISQNCFEHYSDPDSILAEMKHALKPGGRIYITFGPPWFAPYGSHMHFFTKVPWVNVLFTERTVMKVRSRYRRDGAMRYVDVESGLNRMSLSKFERIVRQVGMKIEFSGYECVKRADLLGRVPLLRELAVNRVNAVLST